MMNQFQLDIIEKLLENRGVTADTRETFFNPLYEQLHSPLLLNDCASAVERILLAVEKKERIAVYADFDCDGIPGAVVLHDFFKKINYSEFVHIYIPHRDEEGYGFHISAVDTLKKSGVSLIITVDVGCTSHDTVAYAGTLGIDTIITDHHECTDNLPKAYAIMNPKLGQYPYADLCGAAVAFKLVQALIIVGKQESNPLFADITPGWEKWLLDMVGLATVADIVPLTGENRILAKFGLIVLRKSRRFGVVALCKKARVMQSRITEDDIAFSLAPRINSASRVGDPDVAFQLFATTDVTIAEASAKQIEQWNTQRKAASGVVTKAAKERIKQFESLPDVIVLGSHEWKTSLLGSVASSLVGTYNRPVCLWGREATGNIKGSARSDGSVSMVLLLAGARPAIMQSGGHTGAGGYVVDPARVHELGACILASYATHKHSNKIAFVPDSELLLEQVAQPLLSALDALRPYGEGNRHPIFSLHDIFITHTKQFGKNDEHLEVTIASSRGHTVRGFAFFSNRESMLGSITPETSIRVIGTVERDTFRGGVPTIKLLSVESL
ncbi:MAG: single-stranded-DNA-specific exonuclease RecJ [Minisyncoccia bacterium]